MPAKLRSPVPNRVMEAGSGTTVNGSLFPVISVLPLEIVADPLKKPEPVLMVS